MHYAYRPRLGCSQTSSRRLRLLQDSQATCPAVGPKAASLPQPVETTLVLMSSRQLEITRRWEGLLQRLREQRKWMAGVQAVLSLLQEVETASDQLKELQVGPGPADPWGTRQMCQL